MKRKKIFKTSLWVSALLLTIAALLKYPLIEVYSYESSDRGMAENEIPAKGRTLDIVQLQFASYKRWKQDSSLTLHRTCAPDWSNPWLWWDNIVNERWNIPYIEPSQKPNYDYIFEMESQLRCVEQVGGGQPTTRSESK